MTSNSLVTVYIPTYNRLRLLQRAIESVLAQDYKEIELIIVDDGSTDGTKEYLIELARFDKRVIILDKKGKRGAPSSRNIAIKAASGRFITGLDDDDYFLKYRISEFVANYDSRYAFLFTRVRSYADAFFSPRISLFKTVNFDQLAFFNIVGNQVFIETEKFKSAGGFDEEMPAAQDYDTWLNLTYKYGSAKMLVSNSYVTDESHGAERITDNKEKKIEAYKKIKSKYQFSMAHRKSFDFRISEKTGRLSICCLLNSFNLGSARYFFSYLKKRI